MKEKATIQSGSDVIEIPLEMDDNREVASLQIDGVSYHFERIRKETLLSEYQQRTAKNRDTSPFLELLLGTKD